MYWWHWLVHYIVYGLCLLCRVYSCYEGNRSQQVGMGLTLQFSKFWVSTKVPALIPTEWMYLGWDWNSSISVLLFLTHTYQRSGFLAISHIVSTHHLESDVFLKCTPAKPKTLRLRCLHSSQFPPHSGWGCHSMPVFAFFLNLLLSSSGSTSISGRRREFSHNATEGISTKGDCFWFIHTSWHLQSKQEALS